MLEDPLLEFWSQSCTARTSRKSCDLLAPQVAEVLGGHFPGWAIGKEAMFAPKKMSETATQGLKLSKPSRCDFEMVSDPEPFVVKVWQMLTHASHKFVNPTCSCCS